ncbi:MAG: hypothetical protein IJ338_01040 [Bacteroidaceae bacterium]|nr:hypothetical protein [Bacteroidaceae bacterium]
MQYCNLHNRSDGLFLGYFSLLPEVLGKYPEGVPEGSYFVNGETLSIWVWNESDRELVDTSRPMQSLLSGVVDDPLTYRPKVMKGLKAYYLYITPPAENICFAYFVNGDEPLCITAEKSAIVSLFWDGDFWHVHSVPIKLEASRLESHTEFRFQLTELEDTPPEVDRLSENPGEKWLRQIPESETGLFLWMISAKLDSNNDLFDANTGWSVPVRLTGDKGNTGPHGENSYCMVLSNDSHTVPCRQDGSGGRYDGAHTTCYVFEGSVDISSQYTFNVIVPDGIEYTLGNRNRTVIVSDMEADTGIITFIGECFGKPALQKVFSLAKSKQGFEGEPAVTYRLSVSDIVVRRTSEGQRVPLQLTAESLVQTAGEPPAPYPAYFLVEGIKNDSSRITLLSTVSPVASVSFPTLEGYESYEITLYKSYAEETGFQNWLDKENIPVLRDGADGIGVAGAVLRPRGEWSSTKIYGCFSAYRDVVIYGEDRKYYVAKEGIGAIPAGTLPTDTVYWESFDDYENIATGLLLAENAYIDVLGTSGIRVGNYPHCWVMTSGAITHRVSGLSLTAEGVLSDPDGTHLSVRGQTLLSVMDSKISTSVTETKAYTDNKVSGIQIGGRNLLRNSKGVSDTPIGQAVGYTAAYRALTRTLKSGETVVFSYSGVTSNGIVGFILYNAGESPSPVFKFDTPVTLTKSYAHFRVVVSSSAAFAVDYMKLESGTKATDWTPAPEDVQSELDGKVSLAVYNTGITQLSNQISLKASQTDLNALGNRVSAAESEILLMPDRISLAVNNIQIGGENLLPNISARWNRGRINSQTGAIEVPSGSAWNYIRINIYCADYFPVKGGETLVFTAPTDYSYACFPAQYDANKNFIKVAPDTYYMRNYNGSMEPRSFTLKPQTRYVRYQLQCYYGSDSGDFYPSWFDSHKAQVEIGNKPTSYKQPYTDFHYTGIDVEQGKIILTADKVEITGSLIVKGIQNGGINVGGNCIITSTGLITAKGATIEGKITATSGSIGGVNISDKFIGIASDSTTAVGSYFAANYFGLRNNANYFRVDMSGQSGNSALQCTIDKTTDTTAALHIRNATASTGSIGAMAIYAFGRNELLGGVQVISGSATINDDSKPKIEVTGTDLKVTLRVNNTGAYITGYLRITTSPSSGGAATVQFIRD